MKRRAILVTVLSLAMVTAGYGLVQAHGSQSRNWSIGSWFGMGSGHMGGSNWGHMGSGRHMGGSNWGHMGFAGPRGYGDTFYGGESRRGSDRPLTSDQARDIAEHTLGRNPYLKVGTVTEGNDRFVVEIVTQKGQELVNRMLVEKQTGRVFPVVE